MLTHVAEEGPVGDVTVAAQGDPRGPVALELSQPLGDADEAIVYLDRRDLVVMPLPQNGAGMYRNPRSGSA